MDEDPFQCAGVVEGFRCLDRATQEDGLCDLCRDPSWECSAFWLRMGVGLEHVHVAVTASGEYDFERVPWLHG